MVIITLRTELSRNQRTNLETCITVHMHQKESTEDLLKKKIKDPTDFEWMKQVGKGGEGMCAVRLGWAGYWIGVGVHTVTGCEPCSFVATHSLRMLLCMHTLMFPACFEHRDV